MNAERAGRAPRVEVLRAPMWRIRLKREMPRYLLCGAAIAGLGASARFAIAPPRTATARASAPVARRDPAAEGYAVLFVRRYLSWNAAEPQASEHALEAFLPGGLESGGGFVPPATGEQKVQWAEVVQEREDEPGVHYYTVAAQTDTAGLLYLSVGVRRSASGALELTGFPAFVGAPAATVATPHAQHLREATEPALRTVVERALRNYLAGSYEDLSADLAASAHVSLPSMPLTLEVLQRLTWTEPGSAVLALVQARDSRGGQYSLAYELDVVRAQGRWEIAAVQMEPDS